MGIKIGFKFVPLPVEIWDEQVDISLAEFRLLGYLIRRQLRFGKQAKPLTHDELMNGQWYRGERRDNGCGLSRNSLKQAIADLEGRKWIKVTDLSDNPKFAQVVVEVLISDDESSDSDTQSSKSDNRNQSRSSESDNQSAIQSSESDDCNKEVDKKLVDKNKPVEEPDSVDNRILCESLGIFSIRQQEEIFRLYKTAARDLKLSSAQAQEKIIARWDQYQRIASQCEWKWGSAHKFLMSGLWDKPDMWPKKQETGKPDAWAGMKFTNGGKK